MVTSTFSRSENYPMRCVRTRRNAAHRRRGFTLIETALAVVIVGVGVIAIMGAQQAFHKQNSWSTHASIAQRLGNEIREMTLNLPRHDPVTGDAVWGPEESVLSDYDDLDDFDGPGGGGLIFSARGDPVNGPINARRETITDMVGWSQTVHIEKVDPFNINSAPSDADNYVIRVEVVVDYQGFNDTEPETVTTVSWIAPN